MPDPIRDVVAIDSGAGGGTAIEVLTDLGMNVTLIEAGPMLNPAKDFKEHRWPWEVEHRGAGPNGEAFQGKRMASVCRRSRPCAAMEHGFTVRQAAQGLYSPVVRQSGKLCGARRNDSEALVL